jgi:hypothetical protein
MLDYSKNGPGAFRSVLLPPILEKLERQLQANNASREETERFVRELNLSGAAGLSFADRYYNVSVGEPPTVQARQS